MTEYKIREFIPGKNKNDFKQLLPVFLSIWNNPGNLKFLSFTQKLFEEETVKLWLSNHLSQGIHYYVALNVNNEICGIAVIKIDPVETFEIFGIGVITELRNKGIGSELIEYSIKNAIDLNFNTIDIAVFADNTVMLRLLLSNSFIPVSMDYNRRSDGADLLRLRRFL